MGVLIPNYPKDIVVKGENVPHFSKMSGDKKRNSAVNGILNSTSNVFQILGDMQEWQWAVQSQYDSSTISIFPELASPFRTTTPSAPALTMATAKQADPVHVNALPVQNTSWSGTSSTQCTCPQAATSGPETQRLISLEKTPAPTQWKDLCEQTPIDEARHSVTLFWLLWRYRMFSRRTIQISPEIWAQACKTCFKESSNPPWGCFQKRNQVFGGTRHSGIGKGTHWLGQFICDCGKGLKLPKPHYKEETEDLLGS